MKQLKKFNLNLIKSKIKFKNVLRLTTYLLQPTYLPWLTYLPTYLFWGIYLSTHLGVLIYMFTQTCIPTYFDLKCFKTHKSCHMAQNYFFHVYVSKNLKNKWLKFFKL